MMKRIVWMVLTCSLIGPAWSAVVAAGQTWDNKTVITFSQPVEIPGQVLPAGTYTFKLADSMTDRHIVQIFTADQSRIIATVLAVGDYRLIRTDETVIKFSEVPSGSPQAIRAWFYPGSTVGHEFVYPKPRAAQLAKAAGAVVPAIAVETIDFNLDALKTVRIVALTPDEKEVAVTEVIQTTPAEKVARVAAVEPATTVNTINPSTYALKRTTQNALNATRLPETASTLPLVALLGFGAIVGALGLMVFGRRWVPGSTV